MSSSTDAEVPEAETPDAVAVSSDLPPERRSRLRAREVFGIDAVVVLFIAVPLAVGLSAHIRWGYLFPPDSRYYVTMTLRDMGVSPADALTRQRNLTGFPAESWYFSSSDPVWRMVQVRMLYPLLSVPFVWMFGLSVGMAVVPATAMIVAVLVSTRLVQRLYGPFAALAAGGAFAATAATIWLAMAITDALAICLVALILARLPIGRRSSVRDLVWLGLLSVLLCLTRQVTPMIVGLVAGGWLWAFLFPQRGRPRRIRNEWLAPAAVVAVVSGAGQELCSLVYPYDVSQEFLYASDQPSVHAALLHLPSIAWSLARAEIVNMAQNDRYLLVLTAVSLVWGVLRFRELSSGLFLGGALGVAALVIANGVPSQMRYESVLAPIAVLVLGGLTHRLAPIGLRGGVLEPPTVIIRPRDGRSGVGRRSEARQAFGLAVPGLIIIAGIVGWSATHGSKSLVGVVPTAPSQAAALAGSGRELLPAGTGPSELLIRDVLTSSAAIAQNQPNAMYSIIDWRHPLRYRPMLPSDPGWNQRGPDGTAVIRFGDFTLPQQMRLGAALSLRTEVRPQTFRVLSRRTSDFGEDVTFQVGDAHGQVHRGRATVLYPLRADARGLLTELIFDS